MLRASVLARTQNGNDAVRKLNIEVLHHGGQPAAYGSVTGRLRRAWINILTAVTRNDDLAVLEECERAEAAASMSTVLRMAKDETRRLTGTSRHFCLVMSVVIGV